MFKQPFTPKGTSPTHHVETDTHKHAPKPHTWWKKEPLMPVWPFRTKQETADAKGLLKKPMKRTPGPLVHTGLGPIRGAFVAGVQAFLGVPYSEQPVRFGRASTKKAWKGTYEATYHRGACPEHTSDIAKANVSKYFNDETGDYDLPRNFKYSEDCLKMAIYAPAYAHPESKLAVMVWFHGGGNMWGEASIFNGTALAKEHDVIVISVEYRLGALGQYASEELASETGDGSSGGMNYLIDQQESLRFVKAHIASFGGDPTRISIFGESAGGIAVCNHLASPLTKGLYHRAMIQSGPCTGPWEPLKRSEGIQLGQSCKDALFCEDLACIRKLHWLKVMQANECGLLYISIDGYALKKRPWEYYKEGKLSLPKGGQLLTGFNKGDTLFGDPWWSGGSKSWITKMDSAKFTKHMKTYFPMYSQIILGLYPATLTDFGSSTSVGRQYLTVNADVCVTCPALDVAHVVEDMGHDVYVYDFQYNPSPGFNHNFAGHATEVPFVWGLNDGPSHKNHLNLSPFNNDLSKIMSTYWTSFAKTGTPVAAGSPTWHRFRHKNNGAGQLLRFGPNLGSHYGATVIPLEVNSEHYDRCSLWGATGTGMINDRQADKFCFQQPNITGNQIIGTITQPETKDHIIKNPHAFHGFWKEHEFNVHEGNNWYSRFEPMSGNDDDRDDWNDTP